MLDPRKPTAPNSRPSGKCKCTESARENEAVLRGKGVFMQFLAFSLQSVMGEYEATGKGGITVWPYGLRRFQTNGSSSSFVSWIRSAVQC